MAMKKNPGKPNAPAGTEGEAESGAAESGAAAKKGPVKKAVKNAAPVKAPAKKAAVKKAAVKKAAAAGSEKPVRAPKGIPFICSECYEEFILPATYSRQTVACPECLHVGKRPDDSFLRTVTMHKAGETGAFKKALLFTYMLLLSALFLIWVASPYSSSLVSKDMRGTILAVLALLAASSAGLLMWAVSRYEKNRWEIYF